jgi:hypothetical protein
LVLSNFNLVFLTEKFISLKITKVMGNTQEDLLHNNKMYNAIILQLLFSSIYGLNYCWIRTFLIPLIICSGFMVLHDI